MKKQYLIMALLVPNLNLVASETSNAAVTTATVCAAAVVAANTYYILKMPVTNGVPECKAESAAAVTSAVAASSAVGAVLDNGDLLLPLLSVSAVASTARSLLAYKRLQLSRTKGDAPATGLLPVGRFAWFFGRIAGVPEWEHPDSVARRAAASKALQAAQQAVRDADKAAERPWFNSK